MKISLYFDNFVCFYTKYSLDKWKIHSRILRDKTLDNKLITLDTTFCMGRIFSDLTLSVNYWILIVNAVWLIVDYKVNSRYID